MAVSKSINADVRRILKKAEDALDSGLTAAMTEAGHLKVAVADEYRRLAEFWHHINQ